ncbi:MAG: hypothetical protein KKG99_17440 [Bacteroidetes bacterium]|nr:hypothetical protein [Bacteroidota bacterium]
MYTVFEVGKPYPGAVPNQEGAVMELSQSGLIVLIQFQNISNEELKAFKNSFNSYSYFESNTPVPIPVFVFPFPKPFGAIDVNFNARLVNQTILDDFMNGHGNAITFHLIDGNILKANKLVGLDTKCIKLFHQTIIKQLTTDYSQQDYIKYLDGIFNFSSDELFKMGQIFQKKKPVQADQSQTNISGKSSNNQEIINKCLTGYLKPGMKYNSPLPPELSEWYCYTIDGGHNILSILKIHYQDDMVFTDYLVPCPVKAVLEKGYEIKNGFVVVDLPYSKELGVIIDGKDEF